MVLPNNLSKVTLNNDLSKHADLVKTAWSIKLFQKISLQMLVITGDMSTTSLKTPVS